MTARNGRDPFPQWQGPVSNGSGWGMATADSLDQITHGPAG